MKRILIVTYYWPPCGGVSAQRWLKFAKYLPEEGWQPVIFTAADAAYAILDESLAQQIPSITETHRIPFFEARRFIKRFLQKENIKNSQQKDNLDRLFYMPKSERTWKQNLLLWIRANVFMPDARMFWIRPTAKAIIKYLKENPVDAVVTTGPPHSAHLIGRKVQKATGVPWIADFRDPWTRIEYFEKMPLSSWAKKKHFALEKEVIQQADQVLIVSEAWRDMYAKLNPKRINVLENGFDTADFEDSLPFENTHFLLSHIGTLQEDRNPYMLWECLQELVEEDANFATDLKIQLVGNVDARVVETIQAVGLGDYLDVKGVVSHQEAIRWMKTASLLLLFINKSKANAKGRLTAKIYEYMAAQRPVLMFGPKESDAAQLIKGTQIGQVVDYTEKTALKKLLLANYEAFCTKKLHLDHQYSTAYSRQALTKRLVTFLEGVGRKAFS